MHVLHVHVHVHVMYAREALSNGILHHRCT